GAEGPACGGGRAGTGWSFHGGKARLRRNCAMSGRIAWPKLRYPLVAILRGIRWQETEAIVGALIETGFEAIEIPLNSPEPFVSIEKAAKLAPANVLIGAGTVLTVEDVDRLNDVGGRLLVSPNVE